MAQKVKIHCCCWGPVWSEKWGLDHLFYLIVTDPLPPFLIDTMLCFDSSWIFQVPHLWVGEQKSRGTTISNQNCMIALSFWGKIRREGKKEILTARRHYRNCRCGLGGWSNLNCWYLDDSRHPCKSLQLVSTNKTTFSYKMWRWWCDELTRFLSLESFGINVIDFGWNYGKPTSHRGLGFNQFPFWSHNDAAISGRAEIKSHKRGDYWKVAAHSVWSKPWKYYLFKNQNVLFNKYH